MKTKTSTLEPLVVDQKGAGELLTLSAQTIGKLTKQGLLRPRKVGRRLLYSVEELKRFLAGKDAE